LVMNYPIKKKKSKLLEKLAYKGNRTTLKTVKADVIIKDEH